MRLVRYGFSQLCDEVPQQSEVDWCLQLTAVFILLQDLGLEGKGVLRSVCPFSIIDSFRISVSLDGVLQKQDTENANLSIIRWFFHPAELSNSDDYENIIKRFSRFCDVVVPFLLVKHLTTELKPGNNRLVPLPCLQRLFYAKIIYGPWSSLSAEQKSSLSKKKQLRSPLWGGKGG